MSFTKNVSVAYQFLESADNDYFRKLDDKFSSILSAKSTSGCFDDTKAHYLWKIEEKFNLTGSNAFFVTLAKTKDQLPAWFNDEGKITSIPKHNGSIGELFYGIINPNKRFMILLSATSGSATSSFKKLLNEFSLDMGITTTPLIEDNIDELILNWGFYKKIAVSLKFPTSDDLAEFLTTKFGSKFKLIDDISGLALDMMIGSTKPKHTLDAYPSRELISNLLSNDYCTKLKVSGGDFENENVESIDIKNAVVKYSEKVIINDDYLSIDDAKSLLLRAYNERSKELNGGQ